MIVRKRNIFLAVVDIIIAIDLNIGRSYKSKP